MIIWNDIFDLPLDGGCSCFNFINTKGSWKVEDSKDFLLDYFSLLDWLKTQKLVSKKYIITLTKLANNDIAKSKLAHEESLDLRKQLYMIFSAIASQSIPNQEHIDQYNYYLKEFNNHTKLNITKSGYHISPPLIAENLMEPLFIIIQSSIDIINEMKPNKIKECAECGWIFLDKTKNNRQKWCNPKLCGARVKMRNYYKRQKQN